MNSKLLFFTILFISGNTFAQTGDVEIQNNTNCRMDVQLLATTGACDYVARSFTIAPFNTWGPFDVCTVQATLAWVSAPAPVVCTPSYPTSFVWSGATVRFWACLPTAPSYTDPPSGAGIDDGTGTPCTSYGASYMFPTGQNLSFSVTSATAPRNILIVGN